MFNLAVYKPTRIFAFLCLVYVGLFTSVSANTKPINSASEIDYPPFSITLADGTAGGFSVELMRAALKSIGREVTYDVRPWEDIKLDLAKGQLEALPLVGRTPEREDVFDFTTPYIRLYGAVFVRDDTKDIKVFDDLKGLRIGVLQGDNAEEFMIREGITDQLISTTSFEGAFKKLSKGELDAVVAQRLVGLNLITKLQLDNITTAIAPLKGLRQDFCFAVTEGNKALLAQLNEGLAVVIADGTYDHLHSKWLGILNRENNKNRLFLMIVSYVMGFLMLVFFCLYIYQKKQAHKKIKASEKRYHSVVDSLNDVIFQTDKQGLWTFLNPAWSTVTGFSVEEALNSPFYNYIHPDDRALSKDLFKALIQGEKNSRYEIRILHRTDGHRWIDFYSSVTLDVNNNIIGLSGTLSDISERKKAEEQLRLSSRVFHETHEGIIITDAKGVIVNVNPAFCEITGYSLEEVIGKSHSILKSGKQSREFYVEMWKVLNAKKGWQGEVWNRKKSSEIYAELLTISSILDDKGNIQHFVGIFTDITHSKQQQEKLVQMAHFDVLTQLPNRILLSDRYTQAVAQSKRNKNLLAVCFLDLDNFKPVNDTYGHNIGDELLIEVAKRIKASIRDDDTVSRQGGDEFVLLLGDIKSTTHCEQVLQRIILPLTQVYLINDHSINISASIGVSLYPSDNTDLDVLMRHADQAMYQAKLEGRNRYCFFSTEQNQLSIEKHIHLQEIQKAFSNNEFCLYYQPKVNMAMGNVYGAEALIRWMHPDKGLIPPLKFLPIIEGTKLEIIIGNWVINEALKQLDFWREQGIKLEVSVNISSYHLQGPTFITDLNNSLALYPNVDPKSLQLEILESSSLGDLDTVSHIIKTCINNFGITIALDDFGTGYSSLTHLRSLHADTIKIDQSFVRDMLDDPNDYAIIDGVIRLADSFNRDIIAEGVETIQHGLMLLIIGCKKAQGYGIARPMPADEIPDWLNNYIPYKEWLQSDQINYSVKEKKIQLLQLTINHWYKRFENKILELDKNEQIWPIADHKNCHIGNWIQRAKQDPQFDLDWITILDQKHISMHKIAENISKEYQLGNKENTINGLNELQKTFVQITSILDEPNHSS